MALTGVKDVDLKILLEVGDRELFTICDSKDVYIRRICKDENFWRNRLLKKYGQKALELKPEKRSWKNHYLQITVDLDRFRYNPERFLIHILWSPKGEEFIKYTPEGESIIPSLRVKYNEPFLKAPEWVINNYYFLKIPKFQGYYKDITPEEIFESFRPLVVNPDTIISGTSIYYKYFPKLRYDDD